MLMHGSGRVARRRFITTAAPAQLTERNFGRQTLKSTQGNFSSEKNRYEIRHTKNIIEALSLKRRKIKRSSVKRPSMKRRSITCPGPGELAALLMSSSPLFAVPSFPSDCPSWPGRGDSVYGLSALRISCKLGK